MGISKCGNQRGAGSADKIAVVQHFLNSPSALAGFQGLKKPGFCEKPGFWMCPKGGMNLQSGVVVWFRRNEKGLEL